MAILLTLTGKSHVADNAYAFHFAPSAPLNWTAGQFIRLGLTGVKDDPEGPTRRFTIAAAPDEHTLTIATRLTGTPFKEALAQLRAGDTANLVDLPAGNFVWQAATTPHVFVAQGIGITPFYALIKDRRRQHLPVTASLFYARQPGNQILFEQELRTCAREDPSLKLHFQTTPVTAAQLGAALPNLKDHLIYISGPKPLVTLCLPPYNVPASHLLQDNFPGYAATSY